MLPTSKEKTGLHCRNKLESSYVMELRELGTVFYLKSTGLPSIDTVARGKSPLPQILREAILDIADCNITALEENLFLLIKGCHLGRPCSLVLVHSRYSLDVIHTGCVP